MENTLRLNRLNLGSLRFDMHGKPLARSRASASSPAVLSQRQAKADAATDFLHRAARKIFSRLAAEDGVNGLHQRCCRNGHLLVLPLIEMHLCRAQFAAQINRADWVIQSNDTTLLYSICAA
jgi:hypothetical protein